MRVFYLSATRGTRVNRDEAVGMTMNMSGAPMWDQRYATTECIFGTERERLWQLMCTEFPPYADYQQQTDPEIPVVVLDRR